MVAWSPRLHVLIPLVVLAGVYVVGWWRFTARSPRCLAAHRAARLALAMGGIATLVLTLLGLHRAAHETFAAHMLQHLLLIAVAVPLLLLADPFPAVLWALPAAARRRLPRVLAGRSRARRVWRALTRLPVAWAISTLILWFWHLPPAWNAALARGLLHDVEHLAFAGAAVVFWWPVIDPAPRAAHAAPLAARVVYLVLAAFQSAALGLLLAASPTPLYAYGADTARDALADQALGGLLMWGGGGAIDMLAVLVLVHRFLAAGERPRTPRFLDQSHPVRENEPV